MKSLKLLNNDQQIDFMTLLSNTGSLSIHLIAVYDFRLQKLLARTLKIANLSTIAIRKIN